VSFVPTLTDTQIHILTVAGFVNSGVHATFDTDLDILNDADKLGLGSLLPGPVLSRKAPIQLIFPIQFLLDAMAWMDKFWCRLKSIVSPFLRNI
jgi:hypothetical protein